MRVKGYLIALVVGILLVPAVLSAGVRGWPSGFQPSSDGSVKVYGSQVVSQTVIPGDRFSGVGVSLKNPNLANKEELLVEVKQGDQLVREVALSGAGIADGNYVVISWPPIEQSAGKEYQVIFSAIPVGESEALGLVVTGHKSPELSLMTVGEETSDLGVAMVTYSKPVSPLTSLAAIYGGALHRLVSDWLFALFYFGLIGGIIFWLIRWQRSN